MIKLLDRIFSDSYVYSRVNFIQRLMYRSAFPFAVLLSKLRVSPNQITSSSLVFAVLAFIALIADEGWVLFAVFWGLSILLDFTDGTVARMTGKVSKVAFRYDHMSDIFKLCLLVLGAGIRNDELLFWVLCSVFIFTYPYSEILSHDLINARRRRNEDQQEAPVTDSAPRKNVGSRFVIVRSLSERYPASMGYMRGVYRVIVNFNGHTLLVFFALPAGGYVSIAILMYLNLLVLIVIATNINTLRRISR